MVLGRVSCVHILHRTAMRCPHFPQNRHSTSFHSVSSFVSQKRTPRDAAGSSALREQFEEAELHRGAGRLIFCDAGKEAGAKEEQRQSSLGRISCGSRGSAASRERKRPGGCGSVYQFYI